MTTLDTSADINASISIEAQGNSSLTSTVDINAEISNIVSIASELNIENVTIESSISEGTVVTYDTYDGDYEVTSFLPENLITTSVVLSTSNKLMTDNVTIYSLPVSEEYNDAGGVTMTIGG